MHYNILIPLTSSLVSILFAVGSFSPLFKPITANTYSIGELALFFTRLVELVKPFTVLLDLTT